MRLGEAQRVRRTIRATPRNCRTRLHGLPGRPLALHLQHQRHRAAERRDRPPAQGGGHLPQHRQPSAPSPPPWSKTSTTSGRTTAVSSASTAWPCCCIPTGHPCSPTRSRRASPPSSSTLRELHAIHTTRWDLTEVLGVVGLAGCGDDPTHVDCLAEHPCDTAESFGVTVVNSNQPQELNDWSQASTRVGGMTGRTWRLAPDLPARPPPRAGTLQNLISGREHEYHSRAVVRPSTTGH